MPLNIDDTDNSAITGNPLNLRRVLNGFAFQIKALSGQTSWKVPPHLPITQLGLKGDKGDTGAIGAQGIQGDKGDTGEQGIQGEKGDTGATGAQGIQGVKGDTGATGAQGIQGVKGDTGDSAVITSAAEPINKYSGLTWNEIDSNNNLVEVWNYHGSTSKWRSSLKSARTSNQGQANTIFYIALDPRYDWLLLEWIVSLVSLKTMATSDTLIVYLDRSPNNSTALKGVSISNLSANQFYNSANTLNLILSPSTATATTLRVLVTYIGAAPNYASATELKYQLIRK